MLLFAAAAPAFDGPDGRLTQLNAGPSVAHGCLTDDGSGGACLDGRALASPTAIDLAISPDGGQVYVAGDSGIAVLQRDFADGSLYQSFGVDGCVTSSGLAGGPCVAAPGLGAAYGIAVSPDGTNVYATSYASDKVFAFARTPFTGALTPIGSLAGVAMDGPRAIAVSPDGENVYVTSDGSDAIAVLTRGPGGALSQLAGTAGCVSADTSGGLCGDGNDTVFAAAAEMPVAVSPDGAAVYVAGNGGLVSLSRAADGSLTEQQCLAAPAPPAGCSAAVGLADPSAVAASPGTVYVTSAGTNSLAFFARGPGAALNAPGGCVSDGGSPCGAANGVRAMRGPGGIGLSPDGAALYVASGVGAASRSLAAFSLGAGGTPNQLAGSAGCVAETPGVPASTAGCDDGKALSGAAEVAVSPDNNHAYSAALAPTDGVAAFARTNPPDTAITAAPRTRTKHRRVRFAFTATRPTSFFLCKLDKADFAPCTSPLRTRKLKRRAHTFQVYGVGISGQADPTPAVYRFRVGRNGAEKRRAKHHGKRRGKKKPKKPRRQA